jgi:hypothetical protein
MSDCESNSKKAALVREVLTSEEEVMSATGWQKGGSRLGEGHGDPREQSAAWMDGRRTAKGRGA